MKKIKTAIIGASGYTGAELIRLLANHSHAEIIFLTGDSQAGKSLAEVYPHLSHLNLPDLIGLEKVDFSNVEAVFCCLPHGTTQSVISSLPKHLSVFDLSADFRLEDIKTYAQWYGHEHLAPGLQKTAVYGLSEWAREEVKKTNLVACPGCYPTSVQLPLIPLLKNRLIKSDSIIIDAKSGITGAGRSAKQANLFTELDGGMSAYSIGAHRHAPEIEQELSKAAGKEITVSFTPHLIPMNRGILSTIYVQMEDGISSEDLRNNLQKTYENERFVQIVKKGVTPSTHEVRGTNNCKIGVFETRIANQTIIISVIDNLTKGASGQAVQNFNIRFGFAENIGLEAIALFP